MNRLSSRPALAMALMAAIASFTSGCASDSYAARGAAEGAKTGALAGAVGGMVTSAIFGGNVVEAGVRSAVFGASSGAVVGGMAGSGLDKHAGDPPQPVGDAENRLAEMRDGLSDDTYNGVVALTDCKHDVAIANGRVARESTDDDVELAGIWIEAIAEADRQQELDARALYPEIIARDKTLGSSTDAELRLREGLQELGELRAAGGMPAVCE